MSRVMTIYGFIDICCPTCEWITEIDDIGVSMTTEHCDIASKMDECAFTVTCEGCGKQIKIVPEMHIGVSHP